MTLELAQYRALAAAHSALLDTAQALASENAELKARVQALEARLAESGLASVRLFELCHMDDDGNIVECEFIDAERLPTVLGPSVARELLADPNHDLLFGLPRTETYQTMVKSGVGRFKAPDEAATSGEIIFTVADWKGCLDDEQCAVPDDVVLRVFGPDVRAKLATSPARTSSGLQQVTDAVSGIGRFLTMSPQAADADADAEAVDGLQRRDFTVAQTRFHAHFGAGRLGMGLVVPAVAASGVPFAVVQRPKPRWQEVFDSSKRGDGRIDFKVDGAVVCKDVELINPSVGGTPKVMPPHSMVFGNGPEDLGDILDRATSFSCSLGAAMGRVMLPMLEGRPLRENPAEQPLLFCCENDHDAVAKLKAQLAGKVRVVDCMVDRVCMGRTIKPDSVDIEAEPWRGSIVALDAGLGNERVPFSRQVATLPRSSREAEYLSLRKFSLVNGMHTVMAFMTLVAEYDGSSDREYVLKKYTRLSRDDQRTVEAWRAARIAELLDQFELAELMSWHDLGSEAEVWDLLLDFSDEVLIERFSKVDDLVSRVLGGGVANRWLTRLKPTEQWLAQRLDKRKAREQKVRVLGPNSVTNQEAKEAIKADRYARFFEYAQKRGSASLATRAAAVVPQRVTPEAAAATAARVAAAKTAADAEAAVKELAECAWDSAPGGEATAQELCGRDDAAAGDGGAPAFDLVFEQLRTLTAETRKFCTRELDKTHIALMKEQRSAGGKKFSPTVQKALQEELDKTKKELTEALGASK